MNQNFILTVKLRDLSSLDEKDKAYVPKLKKENSYYVIDIIISKKVLKSDNGNSKVQKEFNFLVVDDYGELKSFSSRWFKVSVCSTVKDFRQK